MPTGVLRERWRILLLKLRESENVSDAFLIRSNTFITFLIVSNDFRELEVNLLKVRN